MIAVKTADDLNHSKKKETGVPGRPIYSEYVQRNE